MLPDRDKQLLAAYAEKIRHADIYGIAQETTLQPAPTLCASTGHTVLLKREDQQPIFSFKLRGAANKIHNLTEAEKKVGVITASAGNHAMGVALASKKLGIKAIIVMVATPAAAGRGRPGCGLVERGGLGKRAGS